MMDEKDREIQELRRQVESLKTEVVKRGKYRRVCNCFKFLVFRLAEEGEIKI